jgi:hypothetical protein
VLTIPNPTEYGSMSAMMLPIPASSS